MEKRGVIFILLLLNLIIFFSFLIIAQEQTAPDIQNTPDTQSEAITSDSNVAIENKEKVNEEETKISNEDNTGDSSLNDDNSNEEDSENILTEVEEEYKNEDLNLDAGMTPDSPFYFVDEFFDKFGDDFKNKEEKIAEINAMIKEGKIEEARESLKNYKKHTENIEEDIDPEKRDEARRSAATVKQSLKEIESEVSESEKEEFVDNIIEREKSIITAVEIADKIKNLCEQLSKLDPSSYYEVCKSEDDSPRWQKKLDRELTEEQKEEAKKFGEIMEQCFETSGRNCNCQEIPFPDFAATCSKAAHLSTKCDEGDEDACKDLDSLEMPELPPHLQDIMDELEGDVVESKYDLHMPPECQKAGAKTPKECSKIMIETHAPPECKEALLKAGVESESEGREICDKIMMKKYAPECVEKGITDQDKCQDYMYGIGNRPKECQKNQIHDVRDCKRFLEEGGRGESMNPGENCKSIENPEERLKCYDGIISGENFEGEGKNFEEKFRNIKEKEIDCAAHCNSRNERWDGLGGECRCYAGEVPEERADDFDSRRYYEEEPPYEEGPGETPPPETIPGEQPPQESPPETIPGEQPPQESPPETTEPSPEPSPEGGGGESGGSITGNAFLDYYFR